MNDCSASFMAEKAKWVWRETVRLHGVDPHTRVASCVSAVELLTVLFYGGVLRFDPCRPRSEARDRFIASKGHGSLALYPILADLGFFPECELARIGKEGSLLGSIPDPTVPGYETVNGSLGHGLGVACGMAMALERKRMPNNVLVLLGDGELYEGSCWEAIMLAGHHGVDNMTAIVDKNGTAMLGHTADIVDQGDLLTRFAGFGWSGCDVDGHDLTAVQAAMERTVAERNGRPKVIVAHTRKGKGIPGIEGAALAHVMSLSLAEVDQLLGESSHE